MVPDVTDTFASDTPRGEAGPTDWVLIAALDCERLTVPPARVSLVDVTGIDIGRGGARSFQVAEGRMRIDLPDRWASQLHARVARDADGWAVEDAGSKNGSWYATEQLEPRTLYTLSISSELPMFSWYFTV